MKDKKTNRKFNSDLDLNKDKIIKRLEAELKEIKYKFNEAENIAQFGFWEVDPVTLDPTWSDGLFKIVGYNPELGQPKYFDQKKFIHPDDWDHFYNALQTVLSTGKDFEFDIRAIKPDGSEIIAHIIAKPKNDENGKVIGVRGTAQDISELKRLEFRIKESEAFYRALFENTGTATLIIDEDTTILMANTQFEKLSSYSKEEVEGQMSWKELVPHEYLEIMEKYHHMRRNIIEEAPEIYEAQLVDKWGNKRFILINVTMIPGNKRSIASLTDLTDIRLAEKKLQESEAQLQSIIKNLDEGLVVSDMDGTLIHWNPRAIKMHGFSNIENGIRKFPEFSEIFELSTRDGNVLPTDQWPVARILHGEHLKDFEIHIRRINSDWERIFNYGGTLVRDAQNQPLMAIITINDITERKKAEEELETTLKRFYTILSNMRAAVLLVTEDGRVESANQAFCDYFGINESPEELLGITASEMLNKIKNAYVYPEEELNRIEEIVSVWQPLIGDEILMAGGKTCLRDFIPISVGKKPYGRLWLHYDITKRKKMEKELANSERRYRYIVEKATAGMFILDRNGKIKYLNEHMAHILGYTKDELMGAHIKTFTDEGKDFYRLRKPVEVQIERYHWFKFVDKEGNIFWSNLTVSPIFNSKKQYYGLLGIVSDINIQKGLEEAFLEREEIFTDVIYDMMEVLNNIVKDRDESGLKNEDLNKIFGNN